MDDCILEMRDITKIFPGVRALDLVNFKVRKGEIHCLVGENGAGKSTLMKILSGIYPWGDYEGAIYYDGELKKFSNIRESTEAGIAIINQELAYVPEMTIFENIYLGHEIMKGRLINRNEQIIQTRKLLKQVRLDINPTTKMSELRVGTQQLVEIAKTLSKSAKVIILDEPTSSLNEQESTNLLSLLRELKRDGVTLIMISHRLKEVVSIADTITVLRDGKTVCSLDATTKNVDEFEIIKYMVGRDMKNIYPHRTEKKCDEILFKVSDWSAFELKKRKNVLKNLSMTVKRGEIVGIAGLMGAGRTEFALSLFGNVPGYKLTSGKIELEGKHLRLDSPMDAIRAGIGYVTEDRKVNGLVLMQDIKFNISISNLSALMKGVVIDEQKEILTASKYQNDLSIKSTSVHQKVRNLSGGNQQKVSLAKLLFTNPKLLILDEPTRGIDVGAKYEIYSLMNQMVAQGMSIIMISSELLELIGMCDRLYVMSDGEFTGELQREEFSEHRIMEMATNIRKEI
ncbi:MAG: sugar ABC transporter ATP-binding protein [Sphaerochaetaceae bacterium]